MMVFAFNVVTELALLVYHSYSLNSEASRRAGHSSLCAGPGLGTGESPQKKSF